MSTPTRRAALHGEHPPALAAALAYATRLGWRVLPCEPGGKRPLAALVPHGLRDATTDPDTIRRWWQERPDANPGVLPPPGVLVLDCDDPRLATELLGEYPALRRAPRQQTPRGGCHIVVSVPEDLHLPTRAGALPGLDLRGLGRAYLVVAPSRTERGAYRWIVRPRPGEAPPACPPALLERLGAARRRPERTTPAAGSEDEAIPAGRRNGTLAAHAGALRRQGLGAEAIEDALLAINARACRPPLDEEEVRRIAASVSRYEPETPAARIVAEVVKGLPDRNDVAAVLPPEAPPEPPEDDDPDEGLPMWRPFPVELLPAPVRDLVVAGAAAIPCDPALVALPALAALSAACGSGLRVRVKRSWTEPLVWWSAVVVPSGEAKSPAWDLALRPVARMERAAGARYEAERAAYEADLEAWQALPRERRSTTPRPAPPRPVRYRTGDPTVEALAGLLRDNPRGILLARDELSGWLGSFDRYARARGGDLPAWLEVYEGRPVVVDRKGEDGALRIERPHVAIAGGIQPWVARDRLSRELLSSGLVGRLTMAWPPPTPRRLTEHDVTEEVEAAYERLLRGLYALPDADMPLSREARAVLAAYIEALDAERRALPDGPLRSAAAKAEAKAVRLAGMLQAAEDVAVGREPEEVTGAVMERAVMLARWLWHETRRVYGLMGWAGMAFEASGRTEAERLLDEMPGTFETAAWVEAVQERGRSRRTAFNWLDRLEEAGHVERGHGQVRKVHDCTIALSALSALSEADTGGKVQKVQKVQSATLHSEDPEVCARHVAGDEATTEDWTDAEAPF
ncbi:MAG: hypothetical protein KatS3mg042_1295 [Rhodothermaceae bacterium]|nr:MAG: hypothetical protein KatS3mg042_1295 [Rhodothermaceae bacterium]